MSRDEQERKKMEKTKKKITFSELFGDKTIEDSLNRLDNPTLIINGTLADGLEFQWEFSTNNALGMDVSRQNLAKIDLTPLTAFRNLEIIHLGYNKLSSIDLSPLQECKKLKKILLNHNRLETINLEPLKDCEMLSNLDLGDNRIRTINLSALRDLEYFDLSYNKLSSIDLSPLQECKKLKKILLDSNELSSIDLSPLQECKKLAEIALNYNRLETIDLEPLRECEMLSILDLGFNRIRTINLLALRNLEIFDLSYNKLSSIDLSPLQECKKLKGLFLTKNNIDAVNVTPVATRFFPRLDGHVKIILNYNLWNKTHLLDSRYMKRSNIIWVKFDHVSLQVEEKTIGIDPDKKQLIINWTLVNATGRDAIVTIEWEPTWYEAKSDLTVELKEGETIREPPIILEAPPEGDYTLPIIFRDNRGLIIKNESKILDIKSRKSKKKKAWNVTVTVGKE